MDRGRYTKTFKLKVVKEAMDPAFEGKEYLIADKYSVRESTVIRWKKNYEQYGEVALLRNFNKVTKNTGDNNKRQKEIIKEKDKKIKELEEEIEILKKAAAFLAKINRD